ncbi:MAG TPA: aminoacyl-tRNA hydrolase [Propionibacterium sp.]|nr:aminoacyl-tRNA hydrolase [Propionibacterium sp.]
MDPGPGVPEGLTIPAGELTERFARASGPGGQGVNTTDSRVQLSFDIAASTTLTDAQRVRLLRHLAGRLVETTLTVDASEHRSQFQNRKAARERMAATLRAALAPPPPARRPTRRTRGSNERRLAAKRIQAEKKRNRRCHEG